METSLPRSGDDPRAEYVRRLDAWKTRHSHCESQHRRIGTTQLGSGLVTLILFGLALGAKVVSVYWVLAPLIGIAVLAVVHARVIEGRERSSRTIAYYERAIARIDNSWAGTGETGERFLSDSHPYSRDLDLFGRGSLFELLCTARTRFGQQTVANWLLTPAPPQVVLSRHQAVEDLKTRLDLRQDIAVLAEDARAVKGEADLAAWAEGAPILGSNFLRFAAAGLAILWVAAIIGWMASGTAYPALLMSLVNVGFTLAYRERAETICGDVQSAARDLGLLSGVLVRLENERFTAPRLIELQASLTSQGRPPSGWISKLNRLMEYLYSRDNLIVRGLDPFILWTFQCAGAVESWRKDTGPAVRDWLEAVGEFEALASLASYAYEHPEDVYPEFVEASPHFEAEGLSHPLLSSRDAVRNDLHFGSELRVLIISGPNMAGKSTFIRSVGINAVLAQCGAPVRARRLRLSPLAVGASICVLDSLQGGISRFYAEIKRLKQIVDLTQESTAVLFLLDEFLGGTNSSDRRLGSEAMVRRLVERGAIGLVTTHDLALAKIAEGLGSRAANAHFQDRLEDGKLLFDYRIQPGIVETSNALDLMRSIGLDV